MVLNRGLEALGTVECFGDRTYSGVFEESAVKYVTLPPTLKRVEHGAFRNCASLKGVKLLDGLEMIGLYAFGGSGLESIETPKSARIICQGAFSDCQRLRRATLNEGLEILGTDDYQRGGKRQNGTFERSSLKDIRLPSTLKAIECGAFRGCKNLRSVQLPDELEKIGEDCFRCSGLERFVSPASVKEIETGAFCECG